MNRIKLLREKFEIEQKVLAIELGVSQPTISDWETGRKKPSSKSILKLADYFNVSVDYLLGRTNDPINYNDPELIADLSGPVLEHFNGDVKKAYEFQKTVESDAKINEYYDFEIEMLERLKAKGYKYHELNERMDPTIIIYKDNFSKIYKMNDLVPNFIKYKNSESVIETILNEKYEDNFSNDNITIAAHHDGGEWTEEELEELENFKKYIKSKRNK